MIIGLTGKNGAGKGEAAAFLKELGYEYHSLSDVVREEITKSGAKITREALIAAANNLRKSFGPGILAERILQRLKVDRHVVVDSIRNPFEVEALRRQKLFTLISVEADPKIRFERMKARKREGDPVTFEAFLELEAKEAVNADPGAQQLDSTAAMANAAIVNNGTVEELKKQLRALITAFAATIERPGWDDYFMEIARGVALRSNCMKRKVAAVVVRDKRIISTGYNGTPRGVKNCSDGGCPRCNALGPSGQKLEECLCSHAEENAIVQAAYHGVSIKGSTLYTTFSPCLICTKMIINSGIAEVVYAKAYSMEERPQKLLEEAGVKIRQLD